MTIQKKIAIIQSNYIPWKGYFDFINSVDEFILYDCVQFTKRDWRNRNLIKTKNGLLWLTVPVVSKGKYFQAISDTKIENSSWPLDHLKSLHHNYNKSDYYNQYKGKIEEIYDQCAKEQYLSKINFIWIKAICEWLNIHTTLSWAPSCDKEIDKTSKLINICKDHHAAVYISGPAAKDYMDENLFTQENIILQYMDYSGYPEYKQQFPEQGFIPNVSILDLLFNHGLNAKNYMKSFNTKVSENAHG